MAADHAAIAAVALLAVPAALAGHAAALLKPPLTRAPLTPRAAARLEALSAATHALAALAALAAAALAGPAWAYATLAAGLIVARAAATHQAVVLAEQSQLAIPPPEGEEPHPLPKPGKAEEAAVAAAAAAATAATATLAATGHPTLALIAAALAAAQLANLHWTRTAAPATPHATKTAIAAKTLPGLTATLLLLLTLQPHP